MMTAATSPSQPPHVAQIDALRGVAALLVSLVFHIHYVIGIYRTGPLDGLPFFTWVHDFGWTMVDLFFVVSGFVFSHVYLEGASLKQGVSFRSFMLARIARLYPLHLATLAATAAILSFGLPPTWSGVRSDAYHFVLNLLFLQESGLNSDYSFNYPSWSLSVEMFCYLAFILAALAGPRTLTTTAIAMLILAPDVTSLGGPVEVHVFRGLFGFFAGHLLCRHRSAFGNVPSLRLALLAGLFFLLPPPPFPNAGVYYAATLWPLLLILGLRSAWLAGPVFRWLGERSYSIYMLHAPVYAAISLFWFAGRPVAPADWPIAAALGGLAVLGLAHLSFRYLEQPARRYIRALGERRDPMKAAKASAEPA